MKKVITGKELREKILEAIHLIGDTVSSTLGPTGNNVLINSSEKSPFITNDGVTIATYLESEDPVLNTILEIIKESSLKTNELVGDGTTTTIVLLQAMIEKGIKEIENGKNPLLLKKELTDTLPLILSDLEKKKRKPKEEDYISIASISANSKEIGQELASLFLRVGRKSSIHLEESSTMNTYVIEKRGYPIEINSLSSLYFQKEKEISLKSPYILILKGTLSELEQVSDCINESLLRNHPLVMIVEEISPSLEQELLSLYINEKKEILAVSLQEFSSHRDQIEMDLSYLSGATIRNIEYEEISFKDLGKVEKLSLTKEEMIFHTNRSITSWILEVQKELLKETDEYEKEFIETRLAKLEHGIITIYIGAPTKTELKEIKMRYEDALCALELAKEGILVGEGLPLLEIGNKLSDITTGFSIMKESLQAPFTKIMENMGKSSSLMIKEIKLHDYQEIYNLEECSLESIHTTSILDPYKVVETSLINAVSIASMILSITYLVVNEEEKTPKEFF